MLDSDQDKAKKPVKLVHYTTAEAAYSILSTGTFYITKITNADDKLELDYGCKKLIEMVKALKIPHTSDDIDIRKDFQFIYITCFTTTDNTYVRKAITKHWKNKANVSIVFKEDFYKVLQEIKKSCLPPKSKDDINNIRTLNFDQVFYVKNCEEIISINLKDSPPNYIPFIKRPKYKCEQEYRLVVNVILSQMRKESREELLNRTFGKGVKIRITEHPDENCYLYFPVKEYVDQIRVLCDVDSASLLRLLEKLEVKLEKVDKF